MRLKGKRKWMAGCSIVTLLPVVLLAAGLWRLTPERVAGSYFDSSGVRIHYTDEGQGTPVILVHGLAVNADIQWRWPGLTQALSRDYRVIALDSRGHGLSGKPHDPAMYGAKMVEDVVALMDHLGIQKAHVAGYSFGGFITLKLMTTHPERLLSAAVCGAGWELPSAENFAFAEAVAQALERGEGFGPLNQRLGLKEKSPRLRNTLRTKLVLYYFNDRRALAAVMRGGGGLAVTEAELQANLVPVLSMVGGTDGLRPGAEELAQRMPNCDFVLIEGGDHMTTPRKPAFLDGLQAFLGKHTPERIDSAFMFRRKQELDVFARHGLSWAVGGFAIIDFYSLTPH